MFGKLLMKISEKMEKGIQKKPEEKVPVNIEKKDLKNQKDLSATESDIIKLKLDDKINVSPDFSPIGSFDSVVDFLIFYDDDDKTRKF
jgi:hypothetical protein